MIVRVWSGATAASDADAYVEYMEKTGLKDYRATAGNRGAVLLRRSLDDKTRFVFISFWDSLDAIGRFAGDEFDRAVFYPEDEAFLVERDLHVDHYEIATADFPSNFNALPFTRLKD